MDFQYFLKLAASPDARRKKQYWQLLKRMYGGSDRAVERLRETRDPNIYHGTRAENIPKIKSEGLKKGPFREFGEGVFFGSKDIADLYGNDRLFSKKYKSRIRVPGLDMDNKEAVKEYLARTPDAEISRGALIRLKRPSELKGTKIKYPDVSKAMVFDVSNERPLHHVAPGLTEIMIAPAGYKTPARSAGRLRRKIENELSKLPYEKILELEENFYKSKKIDPKELDRLLSQSRKSPDQGQYLARILAEDAITPKNPKKLNKLKYYGERSGKRVFDRMNYEFPRHEFFYKQESIGPELLTGSALDAVREHKAVPENAVVRPSPKESKLITQSIQKHKGLSRNAKIGLGVGLGAAAIGTGIALHKKRRKQREGLQKVAYLKELEQWEKRNFRDDRGTVKDMIEQSVENLGEQNRGRIVGALRRQYQALGEVGLKQPFQTEEDLKGFENAKWNKEEFMNTKMYAPHPLFGYKYKLQPRSIYNKWHYDGDGRALFEGQPLRVPAKGLRRLVRKHQVLKPGTKKHERALDDLARRLADEKVVFLNPNTGAPITFDKYRTQSKQ